MAFGNLNLTPNSNSANQQQQSKNRNAASLDLRSRQCAVVGVRSGHSAILGRNALSLILLPLKFMEPCVHPRGTSQVWLLFYTPSDTDPLQNRLVAHFNGPFCHVEIAFAESVGEEPWQRKMWGSSVYQGETVFYQPKRYKRDGYVSFTLEVTRQQLECMKQHCKIVSESMVPFNPWAMYAAFLPWQLMSWRGTFCSKHVTEVLQRARVPHVLALNPCLVTPSSLYRALQQHNKSCETAMVMQMVPSKLGGKVRDDLADRMREHLLAPSLQQKN